MSVSEEFPASNLRQKHVKQLVKTEMCKFFLSNKCGKGPSCQYAHSLSEIREKPDLGKTSMCHDFLATGNCTNPGCRFAHDERELRTTPGFFKTKMCSFARSGRCKYGAACRFAHGPGEMEPCPSAEGALTTPAARASKGERAPPGLAAVRGDGHGSRPDRGAKAGDADQGAGGRDVCSDQSTRDATSASASPEGSGDSVRDGSSARGLRRRRGQAAAPRQCTTLMISNIPGFLTQGAVVSLLEDLTECMRGAFDFFYCPWNSNQDCNLGYAIVNFFSRSAAADFERRWANEPLLPGTHGAKKMKLVPSALQGRAANIQHFSGFSLAHHPDPRFRPLVRAAPDEALRPMALPEEMMQGPVAEPGSYDPRGQGDREEPEDCEEDDDFMDPHQGFYRSQGPHLQGPSDDGARRPAARAATDEGLAHGRPSFVAPLATSSVGRPGRDPPGLHQSRGLYHPTGAPAVPSLERVPPMPTRPALPAGGLDGVRRPLGPGARQGRPGSQAEGMMAWQSWLGGADAYSRAGTPGFPPTRFDPLSIYSRAVPEAADDADEAHSD